MALDSRRHPLLIASLADGLSQLGRLTTSARCSYAPGRSPVTAANSAYRVAALDDSWSDPRPVGHGCADGPVLLVDDVTDTGWTMTMAARVLRRAGAPEVLPFTLASVS